MAILLGFERNFFARCALLSAMLLVLVCFVWDMHCGRESSKRGNCQRNLKFMALEFLAYAQDYDERLPPSRGSGIVGDAGFGWSESIESYIKYPLELQCPSDIYPDSHEPGSRGYSDYWMNSRVCGRDSSAMLRSQSTILAGDGDGGAPDSGASYNKSEFPTNWRSMQGDGQPPWFLRHTGGANYSFVDGHVKWLQPEQVSNDSGQPFTFATK